ncbi:MAG TPA: hypothetical protein VFE15_00315 [Marmoricola sp.]|jgi:hypothetical protein|nr:hypothetical protein [Marmoricola sp.]
MPQTVFLHLGLPKTATTYLQTLMWSDRDRLADQGVLLPGRQRRDHLWASRAVRDDPRLDTFDESRRTAWDRIQADIAAWPGTSVISHEFFAAASAEQAERMVAALAPAEVHLVLTGREPVGMLASSWQESLKNRSSVTLRNFGRAPASDEPAAIWNWRTLDLRLVLERWGPAVPPERVHVLPLPGPGAPRTLIWERFAGLVGFDPAGFDPSASASNPSMGLVEAETLRRLNKHLRDEEFETARDRARFIRTFLADRRLVTRRGEPFWPSQSAIDDCRARGVATVEHIRAAGYDVIGDVEDLLVPDVLEPRRTGSDITEAEVAEVAVELAGRLMHDVRSLTLTNDELVAENRRLRAEAGLRGGVRKRFGRLRGPS